MNFNKIVPGTRIPAPFFDGVSTPNNPTPNPPSLSTLVGTRESPLTNYKGGYTGLGMAGLNSYEGSDRHRWAINPTTGKPEEMYRGFVQGRNQPIDDSGNLEPWQEHYWFKSDPNRPQGIEFAPWVPNQNNMFDNTILPGAVMALTGAAAGGLAAGAGAGAGTGTTATTMDAGSSPMLLADSGTTMSDVSGGMGMVGNDGMQMASVGNTTLGGSPAITGIASGGEPYAATGVASDFGADSAINWDAFTGGSPDFADMSFSNEAWTQPGTLGKMANWIGNNQGLLSLGGNLLSLFGDNKNKQNLQDVGSQAVENSDPWRSQAPRYYGPLYDAVTKGIGGTPYGKYLEDATARKMASMGYNMSGNQMTALGDSLNKGTMDYINAVGPLATGRASNPMAQVVPGMKAADASNQQVGDLARLYGDVLKKSPEIARSLEQLFGLA